jgi:hypothetical protein
MGTMQQGVAAFKACKGAHFRWLRSSISGGHRLMSGNHAINFRTNTMSTEAESAKNTTKLASTESMEIRGVSLGIN